MKVPDINSHTWVRIVPRSRVNEYLNLGWTLIIETQQNHHHAYNCLMEWYGPVKPPEPPKPEIPVE
jgi:hypothetical protein